MIVDIWASHCDFVECVRVHFHVYVQCVGTGVFAYERVRATVYAWGCVMLYDVL